MKELKLEHHTEFETKYRVDEDSIHKLTLSEAMDKIRKYEKVLEPLGITHRNRLTKSLYEMYVRDIEDDKEYTNTEIAANS